MRLISMIAAVDEGMGLGKDNQLLCHLPADLQHFKSTTMGKPIIMGRKTYESIGKPLPGRVNIVLSRTLTAPAGVLVLDSLEKALAESARHEEVLIIGGAELYRHALPLANRLYITRIHHRFQADVFFPEIEADCWQKITTVPRAQDASNPFDLTFETYQRICATEP